MDFGGGRHLTFTVSTQNCGYQRVQAIGSQGRIEIPIPFNPPPGGATRIALDPGGALDGSRIEWIDIAPADQYRLQGEAFSRRIRGQAADGYPLSDAEAQMRVIDALFRSSAAAAGSSWPDQAQRRSLLDSGILRTRCPVAAKMALHTAGASGGKAGSPEPGDREVGLQEMHIDARWRLGQADQRVVAKIALHDAAALDVELGVHQRPERVDHRALDLVLGAAEVDDLAADVGDDGDAIDFEFALPRNGHLGHLGHIATVAELEGNPAPAPLGSGVPQPARFAASCSTARIRPT